MPEVKDVDAFHDMKRDGVAYRRPAAYTDIMLPKNTSLGLIIGGFAFVLGFAMVWHIWWLAIAAGLVILLAVAVRSFDDHSEFCMTAAEVQAIEDQRFAALAKAPSHFEDLLPAHGRPMPREAT